MYNNHSRKFFTPSRDKPPKVVSIPVRFVGPAESRKPDSSIKIQKVFRGFRVRKSLKKIKEIVQEISGIEIMINEATEFLRKDPKERIRLNETLMRLLFRLDSVPGFDSGVRNCRRAVIKKAIALQERLDHIVHDEIEDWVDLGADVAEAGDVADSADVANGDTEEGTEKIDVGMDLDDVAETDDVANGDTEEGMEKIDVGMDLDDEIPDNEVRDCIPKMDGVDIDTRTKSDTEIMERMVEENQKMMDMMKQLCENNQVQAQMLSSLAKRVEVLEKAFVCEMLRKKKSNKNMKTPN